MNWEAEWQLDFDTLILQVILNIQSLVEITTKRIQKHFSEYWRVILKFGEKMWKVCARQAANRFVEPRTKHHIVDMLMLNITMNVKTYHLMRLSKHHSHNMLPNMLDSSNSMCHSYSRSQSLPPPCCQCSYTKIIVRLFALTKSIRSIDH